VGATAKTRRMRHDPLGGVEEGLPPQSSVQRRGEVGERRVKSPAVLGASIHGMQFSLSLSLSSPPSLELWNAATD
jgi:hypothetical protein